MRDGHIPCCSRFLGIRCTIFDEGQYAVVVKKFYKNLLGLYVEIAYPDTDMAVRRKKIKEVEEDAGLYKEFLLWANSPESVEKKKQIYISDFVAVFGRFPEGWAQEELESANGTEVAPAPEGFISPETDGGGEHGRSSCVEPSTFHGFL